MTIRVLDPRLDPEGDAPRMAPPLASLHGATVGLLDNAKIGTAVFLDHLEAMLRERHGVRDVIRRRKPDSSRPVPREMLAELRAVDAIVSAVGD
jgi:hypothetical protein